VLVAGCASRRPPQPELPVPLDRPAPTPAELQAGLTARRSALASFQGQGKIDYEGPDGKLKSANMVVVKAPDKVRIDFRSPFSITYTVVTDGTDLVAYDRGEKTMYRGRPTPANLGRYTRVPADVEMLALLVRGLPPLPADTSQGRVTPVPGGWRLDLPLGRDGELAVTFGVDRLEPLEAMITGAGAARLHAFFGDYKDVDGADVAHSIRAEVPGGGHVRLSYGIIWRDRTHEDNAFRLEAPSGVRVVEMEE